MQAISPLLDISISNKTKDATKSWMPLEDQHHHKYSEEVSSRSQGDVVCFRLLDKQRTCKITCSGSKLEQQVGGRAARRAARVTSGI